MCGMTVLSEMIAIKTLAILICKNKDFSIVACMW